MIRCNMNQEELTDVLYNIKDIINNDMESDKTKVKRIGDLVEMALAQPDFPVPEEELVEFLDKFGEREYYSVCNDRFSGSFCYAEYDYSDEEDILFKLIHGINDGDENWIAQDNFRISVEDFKNCKTFEEKYQAVEEG